MNHIISISEIRTNNRGRPKQIIIGLCDTLKTVHPGYAIMLGETFGQTSINERNKVNAIIRKHWDLIRNDKPSIHYDDDGIPLVSVKE